MKAIIMSAGKATRTVPLTLTRPKALLPVANKPILEHQLDALQGIVDGVVLVVGYKHEMIRARYGNHYGHLAIEYVLQTEQRGTGHAVLQCRDHVGGPILVMNGDDLYAAEDLAAVAARERCALAQRVPDPRRLGVFEVAEGGRVVRLVEKPEVPPSNLANIGVYRFGGEVFDILETLEVSERGEIEITGAVQQLADQGGFWIHEAQGPWLSIGYAWHLLDVNAWLLEHTMVPAIAGVVSPLAELNGKVRVGRGSRIRPGVVIDGPVLIGEDCEVGPNCFLRPGTTLGRGCKVGQGSEVKNSIFFDGAKAPHLNYVGDSILGEGTNLGCGTVTANFRHDGGNHRSVIGGALLDTGRRKLGAIFGDHVHTAIHTSIYPGRKLWPNTSTRPGEVVQYDVVDEA